MGKINKIITLILPPVFIIFYRKFIVKSLTIDVLPIDSKKKNEYWDGDFLSWEDAEKLCAGYDSDSIINKCFESIQKIANGEAVYERDSVLFDKKEYSLGIIASLFLVLNKSNNSLSVLDFGGSLGTSYYQNKEFLRFFTSCKWTIVEQEKFYQLGKKYFENDQLMFSKTIDDCLENNSPNLILVSSSLQYLSNPIHTLNKINNSNVEYILFDRIPFSEKDNFITIQTVPPSIYDASYPCWIFNYEWLVESLTNYKLIFDLASFCDPDQVINKDVLVTWKGFLLGLK
jgi:putative methyltransferase (TIGR04325 family)